MALIKFSGEKLKKLRKERNLTQSVVAEAVNKTTSDISNYENGFASPPADVLLSFQKFFNVKYSEISQENYN